MFASRKHLLLFILLAAFLAGIMFTGGSYVVKDFFPVREKPTDNSLANAESLPGVGPDTIAEIVARSSPAVVKIDTRARLDGNELGDPFFNDPFFRQFFGLPSRPRQEDVGMGSGFVISKDGYILTNEHVIDGADIIQVTVSGFDKQFEAKVVGADYDLDLALLKINADTELPFLNLGDSDKIRVGNWVIAIGNPYGLDHTVTIGVISAKGRPITVKDRQYENLLQTDASINPGNSGGPLLNLKGEVVGINTAINAQAQGIGFAIPTSTVQRVLQDLMSGEKNARPWLGVQVRSIDEEAARYLGLEKMEGALVVGVVPGSPAAKAGLKQWDVIMEYNGNKVKDADSLVGTIKNTGVGDRVTLVVLRNRQTHQVKLTIAEKPRNIR